MEEGSAAFVERHIGIGPEEEKVMLSETGYKDLESFIKSCLPEKIRSAKKLELSAFPGALDEVEVLERLKKIAAKNEVKRSLLGIGYSGTHTPAVIKRNILENPGWYTQYTPYQPEISQGRLEALLNFQTMVCDLTGFPVSNASLLDEATAAAEAIHMCLNISEKSPDNPKVFLSAACHPQTIAVVKTRAKVLGIEVECGDVSNIKFTDNLSALLLQYPDTYGSIEDYRAVISKAKSNGTLVVMAADILALTMLVPPAELGADAAVGSTQRFGVPLGFGGPHAAYMATKDEYKRLLPGRIIGMSKDSKGNPALRLALQTREQHIRREKATSNICTAQVLLAVMASMYAVYHGPKGLRNIAEKVNKLTRIFSKALSEKGFKVLNPSFFDTLHIEVSQAMELVKRAEKEGFNLRFINEKEICISLDELSTLAEVQSLVEILTGKATDKAGYAGVSPALGSQSIPSTLIRKSEYLKNSVFNSYHSETEFLRYVKRLEAKDLSLTASMIPLGSCTMKLNATTEMYPVSWPEFSNMHPFCPENQAEGYQILFKELESALAEITGFDAVSLQPNAGSQGEYAGLLAIHAYHDSKGNHGRNVCLIPKSAHGTNPASAVMAGMKVVVVNCDEKGNIDLEDLKLKVSEHKAQLSCLMQTYPSTHGVYEETMQEICKLIHDNGGQVYMDGANLNALVGLSKPAELGADVCHINLHKTFCIPHGGGGPGMGPIAVAKHLAPFLPNAESPVSAAPWGSASILVIPWIYIAMMGAKGLTSATEIAILSANYIAKRLDKYFPVLYKGKNGLVAHECILDLRDFKKTAGIEVEDVAKRLMDYGFHAPTVSFPVPGTLMVEPTESESKYELDRFCDAMICIWNEIKAIENGKLDKTSNPLKNAPHTARDVTSDNWDRPYSRETAAFPSEHVKLSKFWPAVGRVDGVYGDKNLVCTCPDIESYTDA
jgi:glycine dehydrogenase